MGLDHSLGVLVDETLSHSTQLEGERESGRRGRGRERERRGSRERGGREDAGIKGRRKKRGERKGVGRGRGEREHARLRVASTVVSVLQTLSSFLHINGKEESKRDGMVRR